MQIQGNLHRYTAYKPSTMSLHNSQEKNKRTKMQNHSNNVGEKRA